MTTKPKPVTRRNFLGYAFGGALALLTAQTALTVLRFLKPTTGSGFGGQLYAGKVEEFAVNSVNRVLAGRFYITRTEDGLLALWQKCTHLGCAVPWVEAEGRFHCPCHGSTFNELGEVLGGPAPRPLDTFPITVKSGEVWVDTSRPVQRAAFDPTQITGA
ncbi:MAG: Cytochrome b6-f complex iron-sulfur subunit [Anaerolineae bacterium]|nr:Cytochrome b6-f complex iron-sulfur subunit [Anaerolineae bacterium]